ncbi:MAG: hypothetical protein IBX55_00515 [Methyloprofundus sp.]|nr:hypothetical protein [Methyloprofundus sp.]
MGLNKVDSDINDKIKLAKSDHVSSSELAQLAKHQDLDVRKEVAGNFKTPPDVLIDLINDSWIVRSFLAENPNSPVELLIKLADDEDEYVRSRLATNLKAPVDLLVKLSKDGQNVRMSVAENIRTPVYLLIELACDRSWQVRMCVAINPNTPSDTLTSLSEDGHWGVQYRVAENPNTPIEAIISIIERAKGSVGVSDNGLYEMARSRHLAYLESKNIGDYKEDLSKELFLSCK